MSTTKHRYTIYPTNNKILTCIKDVKFAIITHRFNAQSMQNKGDINFSDSFSLDEVIVISITVYI